MQAYSDVEREAEPYALPDVEVFLVEDHGRVNGEPFVLPHEPGETAYGLVNGWYWWSCFPGCLPDSEPVGPFDTEAEALADAQNIS
jgi:hypothetical protein